MRGLRLLLGFAVGAVLGAEEAVNEQNVLNTYHQGPGLRCKTRMFSAPTQPSDEMELTSRMAEAALLCSQHPGCYGVQLYEGTEEMYCQKWCGRPQFCLSRILADDGSGLLPEEVVEDANFILFIKPKHGSYAMAQPLLQHGPASIPARCSYAGRVAPCFDPLVPRTCKRHHFRPGTRAFVFTDDLQQESRWLLTVDDSYMAHLVKAWAAPNGVDVLLIVPQPGLARWPLSAAVRAQLRALGVQLLEVEWIKPELGKGIPSWAQEWWCVSRDFFKLHVLGLEYEAVIFYDNDVLVNPPDFSKLDTVFNCAYQGYFLTTALHGGFEPLTVAFFALRPSPALLRAVQRYLKKSTFDDDFGWNQMGFGPWGCLDGTDAWCFRSYHIGGECGQGLFYNLFFIADRVFWSALEAEPGSVRPVGVMLDGCIWLYENSLRVKGNPDVPNPCSDVVEKGRCSEVVAYHKVIEGRGCAASEELLGSTASRLLTRYPSDENESLYSSSTMPSYS